MFERLLSFLKSNGVPRRIDSEFLHPALGTDSARAVSGLMGNGWIDEGHAPSSDLRKLVDAYQDESWAPTLRAALERAYPFVPGDWMGILPSQLHNYFVKYAGDDPGVLKSCERFFLSAIQEAGIKPSVEFAYRTARLRKHSVFVPTHDASKEVNNNRNVNGSIVEASGHNVTPDADRIMQLLDLVDDPQMPENIKAAAFTLISYFKQRARHAGK
jgi:hypothetical protein